jgi:hypothetical protein
MTTDPAAKDSTCHIDDAGVGGNTDLTVDLRGLIKQRILSDLCPWTDILQTIPLSDRLFVSGSCGTWLAERFVLHCVPEWKPNDIDVFACLPKVEFEIMVEAFLRWHRDADAISVVHKRHNIVDVTLSCGTTVSFIKCSACSRSEDVIDQFDIDVCRPIVTRHDGDLWVQMSPEVAASIWNRIMNITNRKTNDKFLQYPLQRSLHRAQKYVARGYSFASLKFLSSTNIDFPEHDAACSLNIYDFDCLSLPSR